MARKLSFTVDREPIELDLGGETYTAPPVLSPTALGDLLDKQADMATVFAAISKTDGTPTERGVMDKALGFVADVFDLILVPESAQRFRARLLAKDAPVPFDLGREVLPAIQALVEEFTGRPTQPSPPSAMLPAGDGITSTGGQPQPTWTHSGLTPAGSAT